jgi:hypothetical protein
MAIRKNTRRFDPRYFMDEKTDIIKEEVESLLETEEAWVLERSGVTFAEKFVIGGSSSNPKFGSLGQAKTFKSKDAAKSFAAKSDIHVRVTSKKEMQEALTIGGETYTIDEPTPEEEAFKKLRNVMGLIEKAMLYMTGDEEGGTNPVDVIETVRDLVADEEEPLRISAPTEDPWKLKKRLGIGGSVHDRLGGPRK